MLATSLAPLELPVRIGSPLQAIVLHLAIVTVLGACGTAAASTPDSGPDVAQAKTLSAVKVNGFAGSDYLMPSTGTATRTDTPLIDIPQTIQVIPKKLLDDQSAQSLTDALRNAPGVSVHQGEGNRDQIVLRGVSTKADFFIDGMRDDSERLRDLYNVAHVDVLQGPAAVLFGRGGQGGVVNLVTKQPLADPLHEWTLQGGSFAHGRGTIDLGGPLGENVDYRFNAMAERSGGFRSHDWLHRYAFDPELGVTLSGGGRLVLGMEHAYDNRLADRGIPSRNGRPADVPRATFFGSPTQNHARVRYDAAHLDFSQDLGEHLTLRNRFRVAHTNHYYRNLFPGSAVAPDATFTLSGYWRETARTSYFNQTELVYRFVTGSVQHTLLGGIELLHQQDHDVVVTAAPIKGVPLSAPVVVGVFNLPSRDNAAAAKGAATYLEDQIAFGEHWKALVGGRFDRFRVHADYAYLPSGSATRHTDDVFSPRAGLIWQPVTNDSVYLSYSRTFTPQGSNLALSLKTPNGADLAPQKAVNYEIGNKLELFRGALSLQLAYFRLDLANLTAMDPNNPTQVVLTGKQRNEGFETTLGGALAKGWNAYINFTHLTDATLQNQTSSGAAGARAGLTPRNQASVWTTYAFTPHWGIGGGVMGNSRQYTSFTNAVVLPGYARTDLMGWYENAGYRVQLNVENALRRHYYATANGDNQIMPGAPTTMMLTLRTSF